MRFVQSLVLVTVFFFSHVATADITEAPSIHLPAISGNLDLAKLRGKVVYLDFWASWCKPCKKSFPWMSEIKKKYVADGLEVVAVNLDKDRALADKFLKEFNINFIVAFDSDGGTAENYKIRGMPSSYLIDRAGNLYASHIGFREQDNPKMEQTIQQLLQQH